MKYKIAKGAEDSVSYHGESAEPHKLSDYSQEQLKKLHDAGHTHLVVKEGEEEKEIEDNQGENENEEAPKKRGPKKK